MRGLRRAEPGPARGPGSSRRRRVLLLALATLAFAAVPTAAHAHAVLASSQPEAGQRLGTAPGVVVLGSPSP